MPATTTLSELSTPTPAEALHRLKEGNVRFLNNLREARDPHGDLDRSKESQRPFAAVVACMDSRVSTEMVFDIGIGDMFSLRIAGNVLTEGIIGSLEYAAKVVGTPLILVLGHSNCGAVKAACDSVELGNLTALLAQVHPAVQLARVDGGPRNSSNLEFVQAVAELNVQLMAEQLPQRSTVIRELVRAGAVAIVPAMYDVASGHVRFLEKKTTVAPLVPALNRPTRVFEFGKLIALAASLFFLAGCAGHHEAKPAHSFNKDERHWNPAVGSFDPHPPFGSRRNHHPQQ